MQNKKLISILLLMLSFIILYSPLAEAEKDEKYILIHLDGISAENFSNQFEKGNLPNIESFFNQEGMRKEALTYFPPSTPIVISRIRKGKSAQEGWIVDWDGYYRERIEIVEKSRVTFEMVNSMGRRSRETFFQGAPGLNRIVGASLANLADLTDDYSVLEFYWLSTDTSGHIWGLEAQNKELERFDRNFGRLVKRLDDGVNVIIYSDHGMTFGEEVEVEVPLREIVGEQLQAYSYPNLYLKKPSIVDKEKLTQNLIADTPLDFAFYWAEIDKIIGNHRSGKTIFKIDGEKINYEYQGEDPFGYYQAGYEGEFLTPREWIDLTIDFEFPATPVNIYYFLSNLETGEILTLLNPPKILTGGYVREGEHLSMTLSDMKVPLLLKGPQLKHLYEQENIWLPELFNEEKGLQVNFENNTPEREKHYLSLRGNKEDDLAGSFSYSPSYRWYLGFEAFADNDFQAWVKYDIYSSYLQRFWLGGGLDRIDGDYDPLFKFRYDLIFRRLTVSYLDYFNYLNNRDFSLRFNYSLTSSIDVELVDFKKLGLRFNW